MTLTLNLQPEIERGLLANAAARCLSLIEYVQDMFVRDFGGAVAVSCEPQAPSAQTRDRVELFALLGGLEIDLEHDANSGRESTRAARSANLMDLFEPMRGLLTDEEVDTLFPTSSTGRPVDLG